MFVSILGIVIAAIGFGMVVKTQWMISNFGPIGWAERKIGPGGSITFYNLLGMVLIIAGFIFLFHLHTGLALFLLGPVLPKT